MIHETNEEKNLIIVDETETFNSIYSKDYVPQKYIEKIKQSGYNMASPIIILNSDDYTSIVKSDAEEITVGEKILEIE